MRLSRNARSTRTAARCGPVSITSGGPAREQLGALLGVAGVHVPGIPLARLVHVGPHLVAAVRQHLACRALVPHARERPVRGERDPHEVVLQLLGAHRQCARRRRLAHHGGLEPGDHVRAAHHTAAGPRQLRAQRARRQVGVDHEQRLLAAAARDPLPQLGHPRVDDLPRRGDHAAELGLGLLGHLADARPGEDVVELVAQEDLPLGLERRRQVATREGGERADDLGGHEVALGAAVRALRAALRGERPPVQLEVELADPGRSSALGHAALRPVEELVHAAEALGGHGREGGQLAGPLDHLPRRASAAVAVADREEALRVDVAAAVVAPRRERGGRPDDAVVAAVRVVEEVGQHA